MSFPALVPVLAHSVNEILGSLPEEKRVAESHSTVPYPDHGYEASLIDRHRLFYCLKSTCYLRNPGNTRSLTTFTIREFPTELERTDYCYSAAEGGMWVIGGRYSGSDQIPSTSFLTPGAPKALRFPPPPDHVSRCSAVTVGSSIYVIGGRSKPEDNSTDLSYTFSLDLDTMSWIRHQDIPAKGSFYACGTLDWTKIVCSGGLTVTTDGTKSFSRTMYLFDTDLAGTDSADWKTLSEELGPAPSTNQGQGQGQGQNSDSVDYGKVLAFNVLGSLYFLNEGTITRFVKEGEVKTLDDSALENFVDRRFIYVHSSYIESPETTEWGMVTYAKKKIMF